MLFINAGYCLTNSVSLFSLIWFEWNLLIASLLFIFFPI